MSAMRIKPNDNMDYVYARLDEVRMSQTERLMARAQLARAEAVAEAVFAVVHGSKRLLKTLVLRPFRRMTASLG
jgi:hypothetical protein